MRINLFVFIAQTKTSASHQTVSIHYDHARLGGEKLCNSRTSIKNRSRRSKTHWLDAANVGKVGNLYIEDYQPLLISAKGHGTRQICRTDKFGFPKRHCSRKKIHLGFQTGDLVRAIVTKGKKIGTYVGRVATRATGSFNISTKSGLVQGISHKYCQPIHRKDGYAYQFHGGFSRREE